MKSFIVSLSLSIFAVILIVHGQGIEAALDCQGMGALTPCMLPNDNFNNPTGQFVCRRRFVNGVNQVQPQSLCIQKSWGKSDDRCGCCGGASGCPSPCNETCVGPEGGNPGDMGVFVYDSSNKGSRRCVKPGKSLQLKQQNHTKWKCTGRRNLRTQGEQHGHEGI